MASLQATTINGNATVTGTLSESGYIAYPLREYVINLSSQSATNFYPVAINNPPGADSTWHNQFSVDMASQGGGEAYNMHSMYGEVRGQGWSDQNAFFRIFHNFYQSAERSILGIWRGTQDFYGVIVYLRGGKNYYVRTTSRSAVGYNAVQTLGNAVFAIKNAAGADVSGTSANIAEMLNLINNPSGFYHNDNAYIGTNQVVHLGTTSAPNLSIGGNAANVTGTVLIANGGTGAITAAQARTNLEATTLGSNFFTLANPGAERYVRVNAANTVSLLSAADFKTALGIGAGSGTVTGVTGTAPIASSEGTAPVISLNNNGVTFAKMQQVTGPVAIGRTTASIGDMTTLSGADLAAIIGANTITNATNATSATSATTATTAQRVGQWDAGTFNTGSNSLGSGTRNNSLAPNTYVKQISFEFKYDTFSPDQILGNYGGLITIAPWDGTAVSTGDPNYQLLFSPAAANSTSPPSLYMRAGIDTAWGSWVTLLHSSSSLSTSNLSGTVSVGNGGTGATTFTTGRVLLGNGTTDITTSANLFYNTSTNRLGVGTTTPGYTLDVGGACHASSFPTSSDVRFKKNIQPLTNALQTILSLRGVKYEWNNFIHSERPGYELNAPVIGMIAQEVEDVIPEIVGKWVLNENFQDARSLEYQRIIPYLIEAVKELDNKNKLLEARILALENK